MAEYYDIRVQGHLDPSWSSWFAGLTITNEVEGEAILSGMVVDQTALHSVLARIRDLGLPLLSVNHNPACRSHEPDSPDL
jgi:hypothetical protein